MKILRTTQKDWKSYSEVSAVPSRQNYYWNSDVAVVGDFSAVGSTWSRCWSYVLLVVGEAVCELIRCLSFDVLAGEPGAE